MQTTVLGEFKCPGRHRMRGSFHWARLAGLGPPGLLKRIDPIDTHHVVRLANQTRCLAPILPSPLRFVFDRFQRAAGAWYTFEYLPVGSTQAIQ